MRFKQGMTRGVIRVLATGLAAALISVLPASAIAQEFGDSTPSISLPDISGYAPLSESEPLALGTGGAVTLSAKLTDDGAEITRGLTWRVFKPDPDPEGKLPLVASAQGGTSSTPPTGAQGRPSASPSAATARWRTSSSTPAV
jgi:hypothetical protein